MFELADDLSTTPVCRITIKLYPEDYTRLQRLKEHLGARYVVCLRYALRLYESFRTQQSELENTLPDPSHREGYYWKLYWVKDGKAILVDLPFFSKEPRSSPAEKRRLTLDLSQEDRDRLNHLKKLFSQHSKAANLRYAAKLYEALLVQKEEFPEHCLCWIRGKKAIRARMPLHVK